MTSSALLYHDLLKGTNILEPHLNAVPYTVNQYQFTSPVNKLQLHYQLRSSTLTNFPQLSQKRPLSQTTTMSAFTQNAIRRVATVQVPRAFAASAPRAAFTTSVQLQKTVADTVKETLKPVTEPAKDALKTVDRVVSDKLVDGIDIAGKHHLTPLVPFVSSS